MEIVMMLFLAALFVFLVSGGIISFVLIRRFIWNYTWVLLEDTATGTSITKKGRCKMIGFGDGGEEIFFLKGIKRWRAAYGKRIGKNQICWSVGQDGYWYNITFGSLDKKLREVGVMPVDRDMRYAYASIRKGIENRYNDKTFAEKYGAIMLIGILVIGIVAWGVGNYFTIKKVNEGLSISARASETNEKVMASAERVLSNIATIENGGTGLRPA